MAITGDGSSITHPGCTPTVAMMVIAIVNPSAAIMTWGRNRAATIPAGSTIQGINGLRGPPLRATPVPISSIVTTIA